ncbi:MAG: helix-turn-helix transcriptional regulator [Acidimicrobiales bacterium]|nr:helix-turn-helix transcriptional regulator [Acidimicrobiales bacterium]
MVRRIFGHGALRLYLLTLLAERPMHGYELIRLMEDQFLGLYTPSAGTIYPRLAALEAEGLVTHEEIEGRKVYRLTDAGREEVEARRGELEGLRSQAAEAARTAGNFARQVGEEVRSSIGELRGEWKDLTRQAHHEERRARRQDREVWQSKGRFGPDAPWDLARRWDWDAFGEMMQEWGERFGAGRARRAEGARTTGEGGERGRTAPEETGAGGASAEEEPRATGRRRPPHEEPPEGSAFSGRGSLVGDLQDFVGDVASAVKALELDPERVGRLREALGVAREAVLSALHGPGGSEQAGRRSTTDPDGGHEEQPGG